jgi:hypothetical protein
MCGTQYGKVLLSINKQDIIKHFGIKYPDYFDNVSS